MVKIITWNVNGIRAAAKYGFYKWLKDCDADVVLLQEVRATKEQFQPDWLEPYGYRGFWHEARKKGYSGVGIYTRLSVQPSSLIVGTGKEEFDNEGRLIGFVHNKTFIGSCYFPNSQRAGARLPYKLAFCNQLLATLQNYRKQGLGVVLGGDVNIAHKEIDLANPKQNVGNAGFLPEERQWMTHFLSEGFVDAFRMFESGGGHYTWWKNFPADIRKRNIGWRLDYHFISEELKSSVCSTKIHSEVMGSDHCPVSVELENI